MTQKQVLVSAAFHHDVVWRRPPQEQVAIRQRQIDTAFAALARYPEFRFGFDQAAVVREYLANNPDKVEPLRHYLSAGRVEITGGEETIPDTNLVAGEGLIRNLFLGRLWFQDTFGVIPTVANLDDAFGLSAQLPQIFAQFGYAAFRNARTPGLDPALARDGVLWEGLDGSRIFYAAACHGISEHTHICNLPLVSSPTERPAAAVKEAMAAPGLISFCLYQSEEDLVVPEIVEMVLQSSQTNGTQVRFALDHEILAAIRQARGELPVVKGEFNPSQPGTHISRIGLKQAYRAAEQGLISAEALAACAHLAGMRYPQARFADAWRKLSVVQFHDALCGCHTQAVHRYVLGLCAAASRTTKTTTRAALTRLTSRRGAQPGVAAFNPLLFARREPITLQLPPGQSLRTHDGQILPAERRGQETLVVAEFAACGMTHFSLADAPVPAVAVTAGADAVGKLVRVGAYRVTPRHDGVAIRHDGLDRTIVDGAFPEIRFRLEDGTLWDERILGPMLGENAGVAQLDRCESGPLSTRLVWRGEFRGDPSANPPPPVWDSVRNGKPVVFADLKRLAWEKELVFYHDLERIDARVRLTFKGRNTEVFAAFPLKLDLASTQAWYDIPCGALQRRPYYEVPVGSPEAADAPTHLAAFGGKGAWPAIGWVAYQDKDWGLALANRGTPSHRLQNGTIEVGILRSPTMKSSVFDPPVEACENRTIAYEFALLPYAGDWRTANAHRLGAVFNLPPVIAAERGTDAPASPQSWLKLVAPGIVLSALKWRERGEGLVLRTFETFGRETTGALETAFPVADVQELDLMEQPVRAADPARLHWRPFEIKTLLLTVH